MSDSADSKSESKDERNDEKSKVVIDWDEAMVQVGGDEEFLAEVLGDLLSESRTAEDEIKNAIEEKNYSKIMNAAHRIKGSASYLCCEHLKNVSLQMQEKGHAGTLNPNDKLLNEIKKLYEEFCDCLVALQQEISKWK